ncbi:multicopper oxidase family protein [Paracoccus sp. NGMCC 1.201697]|uniref:Multicopper oxidase family protein n=1 Tax=Paracoccus broussonetiae subsp. drimophilus TaxID=3373869 RepID=A0ABW7LM74_9RHOB
MTLLTRRGFLAAGVAASAMVQFPRIGMAEPPAIGLRAASRTLDIDGRAASVWGLAGPSGQGLILDPGTRFRVDLTNDLPEPTIIHWHGQIPPNAQDGVPDMPMPKLKPGETRSYDYAASPGTYWMHSHIPMQEMRLLAAPLIVRSASDIAADRQEVVMFLHDFAFKSPAEVMEEIAGGHAPSGHEGMDHGAMPMKQPMAGMDHAGMSGHDMSGMAAMQMDLNDYDWDAYLTNDRTLSDPEVIRVERDGRVLLRVVNAAAATVFWIDTGGVQARLVAVDGQGIQPLAGTRFGIAMAQRLDLEIELPGTGSWPILAIREGARERTGLILATAGAKVPKLSPLADQNAAAFDTDMAQEMRLIASDPLPAREVQTSRALMLGGTMQPYHWTIDDRVWGEHVPVTARSGERVEIMFHNMSMMGHPMHLHGHTFQVVEVNGRRFYGARRDTVYVPPMAMVTVALDAGEAARWMLHCHHMPHLETGMMTEFAITT